MVFASANYSVFAGEMVDSSVRPRPKSGTLFRTDANAPIGLDSLQESHRARSSRFPVQRGANYDYASQQFPDAVNFKKFNDDVPAPHREDNPVVDPISGTISLAMDSRAPPYRLSSVRQRAKSARTTSSVNVRPPTPTRQRAKSAVVTIASAREGRRPACQPEEAGWATARPDLAVPEPDKSDTPDSIQNTGQQQTQSAEEEAKARRDVLATKAMYQTSTKRAHEDIQWYKKLPAQPPAPDHHEDKPDKITTRLNIKRYAPTPAGWQAFGRIWDYVQARDGYHIRGPQAAVFCSSHKKDGKIPNYSGHLPDQDTAENMAVPIGRHTQIYRLRPQPTKTACKQNIPGYTGCVHWSAKHPTNFDLGLPIKTTTAGVYRPIPLEEEYSPFHRTGVLSKMVTLTRPYNPFNTVY